MMRGSPQTKQSRKTARRHERAQRCYELFQHDYRKTIGLFSPWYSVPSVLKQRIVEKYR
jgi:hypothetical protein